MLNKRDLAGNARAAVPLLPTIVIADGVELAEHDDGRLEVRRVDAPLGQFGMALVTESPQIATNTVSPFATPSNGPPHSAPQSHMRLCDAEAMTSAITPRTDPSPLGIYIAKLRDERGWGITRLAREAGLNRSMVERVEKGDTQKPQASTIKAFADAFGMSVAELRAGGEASEHGTSDGEDRRS